MLGQISPRALVHRIDALGVRCKHARRCLSDIQRSCCGKLGLPATLGLEHAQSRTNQAEYCRQAETMLDENRTLGEGIDCWIIHIDQKIGTRALALLPKPFLF